MALHPDDDEGELDEAAQCTAREGDGDAGAQPHQSAPVAPADAEDKAAAVQPLGRRDSTRRDLPRCSIADAVEGDEAASNAGLKSSAYVEEEENQSADTRDAELVLLQEDMVLYLRQLDAFPASDGDQLDAALSVRMWSDRPKNRHAYAADRDDSAVFVPMQVVVDDGELFRVIPFRDGVYRGQVVADARTGGDDDTPCGPDAGVEVKETNADDASPIVLTPHGFGVWTSADGSYRCGQWTRGEQTGVGTQQHRGVLEYEGEWAHDAPTGVGFGTFADGSSFAGQWVDGRPCGLGSLRSVMAEATEPIESHASFGWFYGTQCLQSCGSSNIEPSPREAEGWAISSSSVARKVRVAIPATFDEQPLRGLYVAATRLEAWRIAKFQHVVDHWRLVCCEQAVESAKQSRLLAMIAWQKAHAAQQQAIGVHLAQCVAQRKQRDHALVQLTLKSREKHSRVLRVRQFHEQRRATAEFQCELARCCVDTQQDAVDLMESELSAIVQLLEEAKQAQGECGERSRQLQLIKRQIENVSLKINEARLRQEKERVSATKAAHQGGAASRPTTSSIPGTPLVVLPLEAARSNAQARRPAGSAAAVRFGGNQVESDVAVVNPDFVCDVPGCECGIPRDVFMRVGSVLNGES